MDFVRNLPGHGSDRKSGIKHPKIYGTDDYTLEYFDISDPLALKNVVFDGRLCLPGTEDGGRQIKGCPSVYMPLHFWQGLSRKEKIVLAPGYFERMRESVGVIPPDAIFSVGVVRMNVWSGFTDQFADHQRKPLSYLQYKKMTPEQLVEFLDALRR